MSKFFVSTLSAVTSGQIILSCFKLESSKHAGLGILKEKKLGIIRFQVLPMFLKQVFKKGLLNSVFFRIFNTNCLALFNSWHANEWVLCLSGIIPRYIPFLLETRYTDSFVYLSLSLSHLSLIKLISLHPFVFTLSLYHWLNVLIVFSTLVENLLSHSVLCKETHIKKVNPYTLRMF